MTSVRLAVLIALATAGTAHAQSVPYQAEQREQVGSGLGQQDLPPGGVFQPRVEAALQYAGNLTLVPDGQPQVDMAGVELAPGFYASYSSGSVRGAIDYSLIGRAWEESDFNDVSQRLAANGHWQAVPDWFAVRALAGYTQAVIDQSVSDNIGGLGIFDSGNLIDRANASVTPELRRRMGVLEAVANYSLGRVWYLDDDDNEAAAQAAGVQDSEDQSATVSLGTWDADRGVTGRAFYDWTRTEYDDFLPYEYERVGVDAGYRVSGTLRLVADAGLESALDEDTTSGGLDDDFWHLGMAWQPGAQTTIEARYGQRFFGDSFSVDVQRVSRKLEITASYREDPTVRSRRVSLADFEPGDLPVPPVEGDDARNSAAPYVDKPARVSVALRGSRTRVTLTGFNVDRDYIDPQFGDETRVGGSLSARRQFASNLAGSATLRYTDFERESDDTAVDPSAATRTYDTDVTLRLTRKASEKSSASLETGYVNSAGDRQYDGWWIGLRLRYEP